MRLGGGCRGGQVRRHGRGPQRAPRQARDGRLPAPRDKTLPRPAPRRKAGPVSSWRQLAARAGAACASAIARRWLAAAKAPDRPRPRRIHGPARKLGRGCGRLTRSIQLGALRRVCRAWDGPTAWAVAYAAASLGPRSESDSDIAKLCRPADAALRESGSSPATPPRGHGRASLRERGGRRAYGRRRERRATCTGGRGSLPRREARPLLQLADLWLRRRLDTAAPATRRGHSRRRRP